MWLPNQRDLLESVQDNVEQLDFSYQGQTKQGIAVPGYMDTTSLDQLNQSKAQLILGIEPSSVIMGKVYDEVLPTYGLHQDLVEAPTQGMLDEVEKRYRNREDFALVTWSPHWMNQRYDLRYLEDPKDAFGELNNPASITTIVNKDLPKNDPVATAFVNALALDEQQLGDLESKINEVGDPHEGARQWAEGNREMASKRPVLWPMLVMRVSAPSLRMPTIFSANPSALAWSRSGMVIDTPFRVYWRQ